MPNTQPEKPKSEGDKRADGLRNYARYSAMAFQMIATILLAAYLGQWLDKQYGGQTPWFTIVCLLVGLVLAIALPLRGLLK